MTGNDFVKFFLRTPLRVFLGNTMLVTVMGRKTGTEYTLPVGYYRDNDVLWVLSSRDRTWWRNVQGGANIKLLLNGKDMSAFADVVLDENAVEQLLVDHVLRNPVSARSLDVRMQKNVPNGDDVTRLAKKRLFVKIRG